MAGGSHGHLSSADKPALDPEDVKILTDAYEYCLRRLRTIDRSDPITEVIAAKILTIGQTGEADAAVIGEQAIKALNLPIP